MNLESLGRIRKERSRQHPWRYRHSYLDVVEFLLAIDGLGPVDPIDLSFFMGYDEESLYWGGMGQKNGQDFMTFESG